MTKHTFKNGDDLVYQYQHDGMNAGPAKPVVFVGRDPFFDDSAYVIFEGSGQPKEPEVVKLAMLSYRPLAVPDGWRLMDSRELKYGEYEVYDPSDPEKPWSAVVVETSYPMLVVAREKADK